MNLILRSSIRHVSSTASVVSKTIRIEGEGPRSFAGSQNFLNVINKLGIVGLKNPSTGIIYHHFGNLDESVNYIPEYAPESRWTRWEDKAVETETSRCLRIYLERKYGQRVKRAARVGSVNYITVVEFDSAFFVEDVGLFLLEVKHHLTKKVFDGLDDRVKKYLKANGTDKTPKVQVLVGGNIIDNDVKMQCKSRSIHLIDLNGSRHKVVEAEMIDVETQAVEKEKANG